MVGAHLAIAARSARRLRQQAEAQGKPPLPPTRIDKVLSRVLLVVLLGVYALLLLFLIWDGSKIYLGYAHPQDRFYLEHTLTRKACQWNLWCETMIWDIEQNYKSSSSRE